MVRARRWEEEGAGGCEGPGLGWWRHLWVGCCSGGGCPREGADPDPSPPDLTDSSSFQRAKFWVNELQNCEEVRLGWGTWGAAEPHRRGRGAGGGTGPMGASLLPLCLLQGCRIYLCGTKSDLLEEDRRKRGVDFHDVQDYADGTAGHCMGLRCSWLGSAGPSQASTAPSGWGARRDGGPWGSALTLDLQWIRWLQALGLPAWWVRPWLCQGPPQAWHVLTRAGMWPAGSRGRQRGALPWAPASPLSVAVPKG